MNRRTAPLLVAISLVLALLPHLAEADDPAPSVPTITGRAAVGQVLTVQPGTWEPGTVLTHQWFADGTPIAGAEGTSFSVSLAEREHAISVQESGTLDGQPLDPRTSAATLRVLTTGSAKITGTPAAGTTLKTSTRGWTPGSKLSFQWRAGTHEIEGATRSTYRLSARDRGDRLSVTITGSKAGYETDGVRSAASRRVQTPVKPTVVGTYAVGSTLAARHGSWTRGTRFTYRWLANGRSIRHATSSRLRLTKKLGAKRIAVRVTGTNTGYPTVTRTSRTSARVFTAAGKPRVAGTPAVGRTLRVKQGTWMKGTRFTYQWFADGTKIKRANRSSLKLAGRLAAQRINVRVRGTKTGFVPVLRTSGRTARIQRIGKATLRGRATATYRLSVAHGRWVKGTTFRYGWYIGGRKVGSGKSIYVKPSWRGKRLKAVVRGSKKGFRTFRVSSTSSSAIVLPRRTDPITIDDCPSWAPIKGNADSGIYHVPGQRFYDVTNPEDCFTTETAARSYGYRKAKV